MVSKAVVGIAVTGGVLIIWSLVFAMSYFDKASFSVPALTLLVLTVELKQFESSTSNNG